MGNSGWTIGHVGGSISISNGKTSIDGKDIRDLKCPCGNTKSWHYIHTNSKNTKARCSVCNVESTF